MKEPAGIPMPPPPIKPGSRFIRRYLVVISLIIVFIIVSLFWGFHLRTDALIHQQMLQSSRAFFQEIVITRQWLANHQGVFVRMQPGDEVNPYLKNIPGLKTIITDADGNRYMLKNPALVTREISEIAREKGIFQFHITSLAPIRPANAPSGFEREALEAFEKGIKEFYRLESAGGVDSFRYMSPLFTEKSCLRCHGHQGYSVGDVQGGISVTIPVDYIMNQVQRNRMYLALSALGVILVLLLFIFFISRSFVRDLNAAESKLLDMAATDYLTGLLNRRAGFRQIAAEFSRSERSDKPICAIMLDIDYFKDINDTHGHLTGDAVLKWLAEAMRKNLRASDILCRYGGEEFLIVSPEVELNQSLIAAERLRDLVEQSRIPAPDGKIVRMTVSIGLAQRRKTETYENLIGRADQALYEAKRSGRNRTCVG